jgi:hypothetical protein
MPCRRVKPTSTMSRNRGYSRRKRCSTCSRQIANVRPLRSRSLYESVIRRMASRARPASPRIPPVLEWCANGLAQRNVALDAAALALEVETATIIRQAGAISDNTTSDADQLERSYRGASSRRSMRNGRSSRSAFVSSSISRPPKRYDSARADGRASQQDLP